MNTSMKLCKTNSPTTPNSSANAWPTPEAIRVARRYGSHIASSARSTRPPSIGNAGIMLNRIIMVFTNISRSRRPTSRVAATFTQRTPNSHNTPTITTFTAGPASATTNSSDGLSGMRVRRAMPPIGSSTMSRVVIP